MRSVINIMAYIKNIQNMPLPYTVKFLKYYTETQEVEVSVLNRLGEWTKKIIDTEELFTLSVGSNDWARKYTAAVTDFPTPDWESPFIICPAAGTKPQCDLESGSHWYNPNLLHCPCSEVHQRYECSDHKSAASCPAACVPIADDEQQACDDEFAECHVDYEIWWDDTEYCPSATEYWKVVHKEKFFESYLGEWSWQRLEE
jgi:hypothetical protein